MRMLACITIQPHIGKKHKVTPEKLLPFPWEKKKGKKKAEAQTMTLEERRKRMAELVQKLGDELI